MTPAALADLVRASAVDVLTSRGLDHSTLPLVVTVERPRNPEHGDYATNLALQVAKKVGIPPRDLAGWLAGALATRDGVAGAEIAGPGFVNLRITAAARGAIVRQVLADGDRYGRGDVLGRLPAAQGAWVGVDAVRYAHARLCALRRNAAELGVPVPTAEIELDLGLLTHQREGELIRTIGEFGSVLRTAAELGEPHRVARYLEELTAAYHGFHDSCRILPQGDEQTSPLTAPRLALSVATRQVLANGLGLLGVDAPERM